MAPWILRGCCDRVSYMLIFFAQNLDFIDARDYVAGHNEQYYSDEY